MKKIETLIIWSPVFLGVLLILISQIDLYLFQAELVTVRSILGAEFLIVTLGMASGIGVFFYGILCMLGKDWRLGLQAFLTPLLYLILFAIGGALGGAYLNAT